MQFNELQAAGLFLALDGTSTCTDPSTSGRKYCKLVSNAVFIRNESLFDSLYSIACRADAVYVATAACALIGMHW